MVGLRNLIQHAVEAKRLAATAELIDDLAEHLSQSLQAIAANAQASTLRVRAGNADPQDLIDAFEQMAGQALRAGQIVRSERERVETTGGFAPSVDLGALVGNVLGSLRAQARRVDLPVRFECRPQTAPVACYARGLAAAVSVLLLRCIETAGSYAEFERVMRVRVGPSTEPDAVEVCLGVGGFDPSAPWGDSHLDEDPSDAPQLAMEIVVVRALIEAHGGMLWVMAEPRGLCSARFTLPIRRT